MIPTSLEQKSNEIIDDFHAFNDLFFSKIQFPYLEKGDIPFMPVILNDAYSENEPEYNSEDLIWKNPKYDPTR
ncbi:hypothetical protein LFX15_16955 [Leptospira levettii]|uniref:hypothetical protein n=1 Tax=Leptospira levettii TaxID=2023178 RepID=UPI001EEA54DC|nr:hypothetical protein [Leptospira levettii]MCG6149991.1 hypothetical protein [Leptospira levettii]MCW7506440.1 hypothetical protein [Leptospira levettii]MCW7517530.1 hypothetical protein [Leptospira levettii]